MDRTSGLYYSDATGVRLFTNGPPGTRVEETWLNGVQEELIGLIEGTGLTPSASDNTQLLQAMSIFLSCLEKKVWVAWKDVSTVTFQAGWYHIGGGTFLNLAANTDWSWTMDDGGAGDAASTWYYLYAYNNSGTIAFVGSTTAPTGKHNTTLGGTAAMNSNVYLGAIYNDSGQEIYKFGHNGSRFVVYDNWGYVAHSGDILWTDKIVLVPASANIVVGRFAASTDVSDSCYISGDGGSSWITSLNYRRDTWVEVNMTTSQTIYLRCETLFQGAYYYVGGWIDKWV